MASDTAQPGKPTVIYNPLRLNWKNVVAGTVIALLMVAIGVFSFTYYNPDATPVPPVVIKSGTKSAKVATKSAIPSTQKDETAAWETLTSKTIESNPEVFDPTKTINFSFKYPKDFYEVKDSDVTLVTNDQDYQLGVKTPGKLAAWARISNPSFKVDSSSDSGLGGVKALRKLANGVVLYHIPSLKTKEGIDVSFVFQCTYLEKENADTIKTCDLMASTFKFLD